MAVTRSSGGIGTMNGRGAQGMGSQMWNQMGGPMQSNGMGPTTGYNPGWGANQQGGNFQGSLCFIFPPVDTSNLISNR